MSKDLTSPQRSPPSDGRLRRASATALLLLAVYWLTASGRFRSVDEHVVFATARNLVYHGTFNQSSLFWDSPYTDLGMVGLDDELYSKYGIGHSILVALTIIIGRMVPGAGLVTTAMSLNMVATALTALILVLTAARLGYPPRVAVTTGLLYGLCTFAWVYSKTMFGEPLVALGYAAIVWLALGQANWRGALLAGAVMAGITAIRPVMVVTVLPLSLLYCQRDTKQLARCLTVFLLPVAAVSLGLLAYNFFRFGAPFQFGYSETFSGSLTAGVTGFLFSADRSVFIFAPPLIGLLWSMPAFVRRHGSLGWKLLALSSLVLLLHSLWPVFWGGPVWGPRYLLTILPALTLLLVPALERAWSQRGWPSIAMMALVVAGFAIQLPAVVWNPLSMTQTLGQRAPLWLVRPRAAWLDIAWVYARPGGAVVAVAMGGLAAAALRWHRRWLLGAGIAAASAGSLLLLGLLGQTWPTLDERPAYLSALSRVHESGRPGDALVLNPAPYQSPLDVLVWFLNEPVAEIPFYGVYRLPPGEAESSRRRVDHLLGRHPRLWLLTQGTEPGDPNSTTERHLVDTAALVSTSWLEEGYRLSLFEAAQLPTIGGDADALLGESILLDSWEVAWYPERASSLQVTLHWQVRSAPSEALHVFAQALDQSGSLVAGWDGAPGGGLAPSTNWRPGQLVMDRVALTLPDSGVSGPLRLIAGLYNTATGQRLRTQDAAEAVFLTALSH